MAPQVLADASRVGTGNATAMDVLHPLPAGMRWSPDEPAQVSGSGAFSLPDAPLDTGPVALLVGTVALLLTRPLGRVLRRHEQQRRAAALASAIAHGPRR